ncbi:MAG: diaminopimelate epimerase [Firmicutes bacterium]|nr:diaminopimelate epimerase [Bacillota bacterium]
MKFTKMHGLGNDYIYINGFEEQIDNPGDLSIKISDRHFGIGSDGIVLILPSQTCDFRMRMFNNDGSEAEMCGNASRCVAKYVYDFGLTKKEEITLETLAGVKVLKMQVVEGKVDRVTVNMGQPILNTKDIPAVFPKDRVVDEAIEVEGEEYRITCVSMGNPHAITFIDDVENFDVHGIGLKIENHKMFPRRINTEFAQIVDRNTIKMRVWERGSGETLACGTGASATLVASVLNDLTERKAKLILLGGDLEIEWNEADNNVYMTGPATTVFQGEIEI